MAILICAFPVSPESIYRFLRRGNPVGAQPKHIATIVLKDVFSAYAESCGLQKTEVAKLLSKPPERYNSFEKSLFMKRPFLLVWFTWDEDCESPPHQFIKDKTAENFWTAFALSDDYQGRELLAFYLQETATENFNFTIYRPTWIDSDFFDKFKPTDPDDEKRWGQTAPVKSIQ
jgi:hypothetical protein